MRILILPALVAGFFVGGCVDPDGPEGPAQGGPITGDWSPEMRAVLRAGGALALKGTGEILTGPNGYLDPQGVGADLMGLGSRLAVDGLLALNAFDLGADFAGWSLDRPVEALARPEAAAPGLPGGDSDPGLPPSAAEGGDDAAE